MCICTDDKGIFGKGINEEYGVLKEEFGIGEREALQVARGAIDIIFEGENVRKVLNEKFDIADSQLLD